jgi:membrane-associated phospholipid phosphatase
VRVTALLLVVFAAHAAAVERTVPAAAPSPGLRLKLDWSASVVLAAAALAGWGADARYTGGDAGPCRWCEPGALDLAARDALRWDDARAAGDAADALRVGVPLGSAAAIAWLAARSGGGAGEVVEDLLVVGTALAVVVPVTSAVKHGAGRLRPEPWAEGRPGSGSEVHSFFSAHTAVVFGAAAAATQVARLRRRPGWGWVAAGAFTAAGATAWLRVAGDQHWATDVLAGAAAGTAIGLSVPPLMLRRPGAGATLAAAPGGIALVF